MTLEVDNRIGHSTLPVGNEGGTAFFGSDNAGIPAVEAGKARQQMQGVNLPNFDFFNYAGITRPVHLYTTPAAYIADIALAPAMDGTLDYKINTIGDGLASIEILNDEGKVVADGKGESGTLHVEEPTCGSTAPEMFTEEFQVEYYKTINACLDSRPFVVGEWPWNFADFSTQQGPMRVGSCNRKGLFTRERTPKLDAHYFKDRWAKKQPNDR